MIFEMTAFNLQNSLIEGHVTNARTCLHLQNMERAHAQLHLSRVGLSLFT